jgi:hypothetical protein
MRTAAILAVATAVAGSTALPSAATAASTANASDATSAQAPVVGHSAKRTRATRRRARRARRARPRITRVRPMRVALGQRLVIQGRRFKAKRRRNTVIFRARGGRTVFSKPRRASRRRLVVKVPASVARLLTLRGGRQRPTRLKLRVLAGRFSAFTPRRLSPVVVGLGGSDGGPGGGGLAVCNSDSDHDNDLLSNQLELQIGLDPCLMDTDGDGIEDGYEYKSAKDLNDDESQDPNTYLPYPGKRPYPNPLDPSDANIDFDGDVLTLREEQRLWRYGIAQGRAARTLDPLYYSDGEQYSIFRRDAQGKRRPDLPAAGYSLQQSFLSWAAAHGYRNVELVDFQEPWWDPNATAASYGLLDFDRDGSESAAAPLGYFHPELTYYDHLPDGYLSDDERDEDADGLTNYDEAHGRMTPEYWSSCYGGESAFGIAYGSTDMTDPDTDGDGIRDGADDQDHDDIPNVMELSRNAASGLWDGLSECKPVEGLPSPPDTHHPDAYGRVNPFNPCLPAYLSRTCTLHPSFAGDAAPYDNSLDWAALN